MSLQLPEGVDPQMLAQMLSQQAPPSGLGQDEDAAADQQEDPLQILQECIQQLPRVIAALPDPQDTQDATQALLTLTKIQTRMMRGGGTGGPQTG